MCNHIVFYRFLLEYKSEGNNLPTIRTQAVLAVRHLFGEMVSPAKWVGWAARRQVVVLCLNHC